MIEADPDVAAFWTAVFEHNEELVDLVLAFKPDIGSVERVSRGGASGACGARVPDAGDEPDEERGDPLAARAGVMRKTPGGAVVPGDAGGADPRGGEARAAAAVPAGGRRGIPRRAGRSPPGARFFVDPPYTADGGAKAGLRLYRSGEIDEERLFRTLAEGGSDFLMTQDETEGGGGTDPEVRVPRRGGGNEDGPARAGPRAADHAAAGVPGRRGRRRIVG